MPCRWKSGFAANEPESDTSSGISPSHFPVSLNVRLLRLWKTVKGVRRAKAALSCGCKSHLATAPASSNRSGYGGNDMAEAFG